MNSYHNILGKLNNFIRRYYTKMLIKGVLLFLGLGLLFFFIVVGVEYLLWLNSTGRLLLLLLFITTEAFLLFRYILTPIFYLFRIKKGISNKQASLLIGTHFPEVGDKLYNLLDLAEDKNQSELLLASIEQRSERMRPIPFTRAVDFRDNLKYTRYLLVPGILLVLVWISGNYALFFGSADRVMNYNLAYQPPAPFSFQLLSNTLDVLDSESYTIEVTTVGNVQPEALFITMNGKESLLQKQNGSYQYTFTPPLERTEFSFLANGIRSKTYVLNALKTPIIQDFNIKLDYPGYTNKSSEILKSTGNATFPEGTKVTWEIRGANTEKIKLLTPDTTLAFSKEGERFRLQRQIFSDFPYELSTSNKNVTDYEKLAYRFNVIKDAYPTIKVRQVMDSLNPNLSYYIGEATDDYKLTGIKLVYYDDSDPVQKQNLTLGTPNANFDQFYYTFPSGLNLEPGKRYSLHFEATDNDAIHNGKTTASQVFSFALLDESQLRNKELESQQSLIDNMGRSLDKFEQQKEVLKEINQTQKEKTQLNFNDQNQIKDFLKKQERQEDLMQKFSKQLKENLDKGQRDDQMNKLLQERLERQEIEAKKNEKLLEELNRIADKIKKEDLTKKLEELGKKQQNSQRGLEQLLELTKRYYVTEKANQLARDLDAEAKRQEILSKLKIGEEFTDKEQKKLNENFEKIAAQLDELKKDNEELKKPLDLDIDEEQKKGIAEDQKDALEEIKKYEGEEQSNESSESDEKKKAAEGAAKKQKSAAQKMKKMSEELSQSASSSGSDATITEDAEMLRQILDNLVTFSFKQENLYDSLEDIEADNVQFSSTVRSQRELRNLFEHVDDSLFALSLRRAELSEFVNEQITEVYYNIDKSLESMAESQIYQGASYQKYVLSASNSLADFLARMLDNMQQSMMSGQGKGQGQDFQLPDIIKGQGELKDKMEGMGQSGQGKPSEGQGEGQQGNKEEKNGEGQGESGEGEKEGKGKNGKQGEDGRGQGRGENGQQGGQGGGESNEFELQEIYEIYKEQQLLRQKLEQQLQDLINASDRKLGEKLIKQMEDFENDLLENGITQRGLNKINNIQYELLKLENAALKQGKKPERESRSNTKEFQNPIITRPAVLENYRNEIEILNRQALPLRQNFQNRVKEYFKSDD
ncbi:MAG: hypothetical protein HKN31_10265 [Pricia sp.]|nr:hypothetical protein [Pricia sp.]